MQGHLVRFPGAPHGMHGPHPISPTGAPAIGRPEPFAGSPSRGGAHLGGAHGPHAMPSNEHGPGNNQSAPHDTRRGLAAQDDQPSQDAQGEGASRMTDLSGGGGQQQDQDDGPARPGEKT